MRFWFPTKPYNFIDAVNRAAAATGSVRYAMQAQAADYNGHAWSMSWNDYRGYYVVETFWGGRIVACRTEDVEQAFRACLDLWRRGERGTSVDMQPRPEDEARFLELVASQGEAREWSKEIEAEHIATFPDAWKQKLLNDAIFWDRHFGPVRVPALLKAATPEEYEAAIGRR